MKTLNILHFNDVENIEEKEKADEDGILGGAARFVTAFEQHGKAKKLCLFSGDLFAPSILSTVFKGE
jgi:5'-nucleotidase